MRISDWISDVCSSDLRGEPSSDLVAIAMAFLGVTVGSDILQVLVTWKSVDLAWRVGNRLRLDLCRHALRLDLDWHGRHSPGLLIERLDGDEIGRAHV